MKTETKRQIQNVGWILFIVYLIFLLYFLFFSEGYGRKNWTEADYRYNLMLFKEIARFWSWRQQLGIEAVFLNLFGNVIGFLPFGFILPILNTKMRGMWKVGLSGFLMSFTVESIQLLLKVGCFDVDDLLLNTTGVIAGYCLFVMCNGIRRWICEKTI